MLWIWLWLCVCVFADLSNVKIKDEEGGEEESHSSLKYCRHIILSFSRLWKFACVETWSVYRILNVIFFFARRHHRRSRRLASSIYTLWCRLSICGILWIIALLLLSSILKYSNSFQINHRIKLVTKLILNRNVDLYDTMSRRS